MCQQKPVFILGTRSIETCWDRNGQGIAFPFNNHVYGIKEIDEGAIPDAVIHDMTELIPLIEAELERDKQFVVGGNLGEIKAIFRCR